MLVPLEMSDEVRLASLSCITTKPYTFVPDTSLSKVIRFVGYSEKNLSLIFFSEVPDECWEKVNWPSEFLSYYVSSFIPCYVNFALERVSSNNQWFIQIKL